jgi:hypothetical protein
LETNTDFLLSYISSDSAICFAKTDARFFFADNDTELDPNSFTDQEIIRFTGGLAGSPNMIQYSFASLNNVRFNASVYWSFDVQGLSGDVAIKSNIHTFRVCHPDLPWLN